MTTNMDPSSTNDTAPQNTDNSRFFENLAYRPQKGEKRKRDLSPAPTASSPTYPQVGNTINTEAQPAVQSHHDNTEHDEKRRRGNYPEDSTPADEDDHRYLFHELFGEDDPQAAKDPRQNMSLALNSMALKEKETVAHRVARRRRAAADPFVPRKPNYKGAVVRRKAHSQAPVFGLASLMGPDEQTMVLALREARKPKVGFLPFVENLPARAPRVTRALAKTIVKEEFCVCKSPSDDTLVQCKFCTEHFHPACVGKGLHGEAGQQDDRQHATRLSDANYYREKGGFTCPSCDDKWFSKKRWTTRQFETEKRRRDKLFSAKDWLGEHGRPKQCSNCHDQITSKRYECKYCEHFDLCRKCFTDPYMSSKHQHDDGDMDLN